MMGMGQAIGGASQLAGQAMNAVGGAIKGVTGIVGGIIGSGKRKREQRAAQKEFDISKARYENLDTSNLAANMENTFEDLTVNTQQADFQAQQQQQALANTMGSMSGAAGGSGIAALAQSLAQQGQLAAQKSAAGIGQQEAANQMAAARQGMQIQQLKGQGEAASQRMTMQHEEGLMGAAMGRKEAADAATAAATQQQIGAVSNMVAPGGDIGGGLAAKGFSAIKGLFS